MKFKVDQNILFVIKLILRGKNMKHICDEKGCRIVSDEEYEEYIKQQNKKAAEDNKNKDKKK